MKTSKTAVSPTSSDPRGDLSALADAVPVLISQVDRELRYVRVNRAYELWFGLRREDIEGRPVSDILGEDAFERVEPHLRAALKGLDVVFEMELPYRAGGRRHVRAHYLPTADGLVALVSDVTSSKRGESLLRFLAEASRLLSSSLDVESGLLRTAELVARDWADGCVIDLFDERGVPRRRAGAGWTEEIDRRWPANPTLLHGEIREAPGDVTLMRVPMSVSERVIGSLTCAALGTGKRFGRPELEIAQALAERAAVAVENARLYDQRLREQERSELLSTASRLFAESNHDLPELLARLSDVLVPGLADSCEVRRLSGDGRSTRTLAVRHRDGIGEAPLEGLSDELFRGGKALYLPDGAPGSRILVPMRSRGRIVGALGVSRSPGRTPFTEADLEGVQKLADRAALAIESSDAFEQLRSEKEAALRREEELRRVKEELAREVSDLQALRDFSSRLSGNRDIQRVMRDTLEAAGRASGARMGFIELVDRERGALYVAATIGHRSDLLDRLNYVSIAEGQGACGTAAFRRERVIVEDVETDPLFGPYRDVARWAGFRSVWSVPLFGRGGELLGVLAQHHPEARRPSEREIRMVELFASQAAHVIENARLFAEARRLNQDLERRVAERTASLEETLRELETFAYSVAHDLRAPLRAMDGFGQILADEHGDRLGPEGQAIARRVSEAGRRMDRLIQDLLAYSRLSREEVALGTADLGKALDGALAQLETQLREADARVEARRPLPSVRGHERILEQALTNLLSNALKFVAPGVAPRVEVWAERRGGRVRAWVRDNGIGIAPEDQGRLFRVFERLHPSSGYAGTGIGLAIVRRALERMGGGAGVESRPGEGSRFWIELPAAEERA